MLKLIKGVMFNFDRNKEITHTMRAAYVSVFQWGQYEFETCQEFFERSKNSTSVITQYYVSIRQDMGVVNQLGPKEYAQENTP